jgi:hypothetical protein
MENAFLVSQGEGHPLMYDVPSYVISLVLFLLMAAALQFGRRLGDRRKERENDDSKGHANAVQGSLLGILALLLGFTFSLSLGRFDQRSVEVVNEANAIGTAWLRTDLVSDTHRTQVKQLLYQYGQIREETVQVSAADATQRAELIAKAESVFADLWRIAATEARETGTPVSMGVVASLNDMIDALATRDAAISRHVPELVLYLLFGTFVLLGGVIGYSSAITGVRPGVPVYSLMTLIIILVFLIIDLDRPRRGLIEVDQSKLISAVAAMKAP